MRAVPWRRRSLIALSFVFLALGGSQIGEGAFIHAKAWAAQVLLERAWRKRLAGVIPSDAKPWPWADTAPVARLRAPRVGIDRIILGGASGRTLAFGPAHLEGTAPPGEPGHSVITGHRDTHFRFLKDLRVGDLLSLQLPSGQVAKYAVIGFEIFDSRSTRIAGAFGRSLMTLVTCYPFDAIEPGQPMRYAVFSERQVDG